MTESAVLDKPLLRHRSLRDRSARQLSAWRFTRYLLAAVIAAAGVLAVLNEHAFREVEMQIASRIIPVLLSTEAIGSVFQGDPAIAFEAGGPWFALVITIECSIALYLGPLLVLAAGFIAMPRMNFARIAIATVVSFAGMVLLNQARFVMLASALSLGGRESFEWMHSLVGSTMMLIGIAGCLTLFFRVVVVGSRRAVAKAAGGKL